MISFYQIPFIFWLRWLTTKFYLELKYKSKHLELEYMVEVKNCTFGYYNKIYKYSRLRNSQLGDFTYVARNSQVHNTKVGKFCCIGPHVSLGNGTHPSAKFVSSHPLFYSTLGQSSGLVIVENNLFDEFPFTEIGNDVWIGNNVTIQPGIKIMDGAIVGSGSVVTKDVEPYSIVGGVPAKLIKYRFTENEIAFLLKMKWWDRELDWLKKNKHQFQNIGEFILQNEQK
jgi:acetyltransferase-like isoleucine patch superfamily enzyme